MCLKETKLTKLTTIFSALTGNFVDIKLTSELQFEKIQINDSVEKVTKKLSTVSNEPNKSNYLNTFDR